MLDCKDIIIKHYGGGMSGSELAAKGFGSKSGINDFLRAFEACEKISYPLPEGITNYGIAELVYRTATACTLWENHTSAACHAVSAAMDVASAPALSVQ